MHIRKSSPDENSGRVKAELCLSNCAHLWDCAKGFDLQQICRQAAIIHPHQTLLIQLLCDVTANVSTFLSKLHLMLLQVWT